MVSPPIGLSQHFVYSGIASLASSLLGLICMSASSLVSKAGTILVRLWITHGIWNSASGIRGDQEILVGLNFIANDISKEGW